AGCLGNGQHAAVDMVRHAGDHPRGRRAQAFRPILTHEIVIAADAAGRDDDAGRFERELADNHARTFLAALDGARLEDIAGDAVDGAGGFGDFIDAMTVFERDEALRGRLDRAFRERFENARSRTPGDVKTRYGIAVADRVMAAALGPADDRKPAHA